MKIHNPNTGMPSTDSRKARKFARRGVQLAQRLNKRYNQIEAGDGFKMLDRTIRKYCGGCCLY